MGEKGQYTVSERLSILEDAFERELRHERERVDLIIKARDDARDHQYEITEQHLEDLNGHNEETRKNLEITISRNEYNGLLNGPVAQLLKFMERTEAANVERDKSITALITDSKVFASFKDNILGRISVIAGAAALGGGGVAALLGWLKAM
jgi:hypothetical protein